MLFHASRSVFSTVAVLLALVASVHAADFQPRGGQRPPRAETTITTTTSSDSLGFTNTNTETRTLPTVSPPVSTLNGTVTTSTTTHDSSVSSPTSKVTHTTARNQTTTTTTTTTTTSSRSSTTTSRRSGAASLRTNMFLGTTNGLISMGLGALGVGVAFIAQATLAI